jgi:hypothetical protein
MFEIGTIYSSKPTTLLPYKLLNFHYARLNHEVYFIFSIYLNHKKNAATPFTIVAITKITRRNTMHKNTRNILGNPSQQGNKTQQSFVVFSRERPPTP